jgi:hypothetical protein
MSRVVLTPPVADGEFTLGDLERQGLLPKALVGHFYRTYPSGWRHLSLRQEDALADGRMGELRDGIAEDEALVIECALRIRELEQRREKLAARA